MRYDDLTYTTERYTAEITAKDYITGFRRAEYFIKLCQQCGNYGRRYGCPYCGGAACARIDGKPCKHPDKVCPSLEAIGFDISKTAKDLLGLEIKWSQDGLIPEYLTLVCGIFYQETSNKQDL